MGCFDTKDEATTAWNTRASDAELEALRVLLDECSFCLHEAACSEDGIDADRAVDLCNTIGKRAAYAGTVSAWDAWSNLWDAMCDALGLEREQEDTPLPFLRERMTELARLRARCSAFDLIESERDKLRAEIAELRKDADRYQWLREGNNDELVMFTHDGTASRKFDPRFDNSWLLRKEKLDAAIDAAIAQQTGEPHERNG
jgi:hypothetical protein